MDTLQETGRSDCIVKHNVPALQFVNSLSRIAPIIHAYFQNIDCRRIPRLSAFDKHRSGFRIRSVACPGFAERAVASDSVGQTVVHFDQHYFTGSDRAGGSHIRCPKGEMSVTIQAANTCTGKIGEG
jgi:hypothetical protein